MAPLHILLILGLIATGESANNVSQSNSSQVENTTLPVSQQAERRMTVDVYDDSLSDSTNNMASFSSVVIHHPVGVTHTGDQPTSKWTIEDHKQASYQRSSEVEQPSYQPGRRHRHHSRGTAVFSGNRDEATEQPESFSTAQTFFRMRGYKKAVVEKEEDSPEHNTNFGFDDGTSIGTHSDHSLPAGMTHDLMNALLSQHPQTFEYGYKSPSRVDETLKNQDSHPTNRPSRKQQKKYKNQVQTEAAEKAKKRLNNKNRDSFNVGYSIGFGDPTFATATESTAIQDTPNDVVLGKPKSHGTRSSFKLHVNGENSVWKEIHPGVEMSEETVKNSPLSLAIPENPQFYQTEPAVGILAGHPGQGVYYLNGIPQDYNNVPTTGQSTFDHAYALGQSNTFDFSNAVSHPLSALSAIQSVIPQNKQDSLNGVKVGKHIPFNKLNQQNYHIPVIPQKTPLSHSNQASAYLPFSLDKIKQSGSLSSKSGNEFNPSTLLKSSKNQNVISPSGLAGGYDLSQFMGYGTPVPVQNVYIPASQEGGGQMVPAIVIPISQLNGFDNFGGGLNYMNDANDGFQGFGGDVFNVVPTSAPKETKKLHNTNKQTFPKPHTPRIHENKPVRAGKGGYPGISSLINLSAPEHLDSRRPHPKHPRSDSHRHHSNQKPLPPNQKQLTSNQKPLSMNQKHLPLNQKALLPNQKAYAKFPPPNNFRDSSANLKRSPTNRNARLAQLQSELNSILAEEMFRKNRPTRRQTGGPHPQARAP